MTESEPLACRLNSDIYKRFERLAEEAGKTKSALAAEAIEEYVIVKDKVARESYRISLENRKQQCDLEIKKQEALKMALGEELKRIREEAHQVKQDNKAMYADTCEQITQNVANGVVVLELLPWEQFKNVLLDASMKLDIRPENAERFFKEIYYSHSRFDFVRDAVGTLMPHSEQELAQYVGKMTEFKAINPLEGADIVQWLIPRLYQKYKESKEPIDLGNAPGGN